MFRPSEFEYRREQYWYFHTSSGGYLVAGDWSDLLNHCLAFIFSIQVTVAIVDVDGT